MIVNPYTGILSGASAQVSKKGLTARIDNEIAKLASGSRVVTPSDDVASISLAVKLQSQNTVIRQASINIAQASSIVEVAKQGVSSIQQGVQRLQQLAVQANSGAVDDNTRKALDVEFQGVVSEIARVAGNTRFGGRNLLDGSLSGSESLDVAGLLAAEGQGKGGELSIENIAPASLFGGKYLSIATQTGAQEASKVLADAAKQLETVQANLGSFAQNLDYADANLQTISQNQAAALSDLTDADFAQTSTDYVSSILQKEAGILTQVQVKRLAPSMLQLLGGAPGQVS